eukprot:gene25751-8156_t
MSYTVRLNAPDEKLGVSYESAFRPHAFGSGGPLKREICADLAGETVDSLREAWGLHNAGGRSGELIVVATQQQQLDRAAPETHVLEFCIWDGPPRGGGGGVQE